MNDDRTTRDTILVEAVRAQRDRIVETIRYVHAHAEIAHDEIASSAHLAETLRADLEVVAPWAGMATGFSATLEGSRHGPTVGLMMVYDAVALPDGAGGLRASHSCGHGPVSGAVIGAALALASLRADLAGRIVVLGCPADELVSPRAIREGSGKANALDAGALAGIDYVLYVHPESGTGVWRDSRWMQLIDVTVPGRVDPATWELPFESYRIDEYEPGDETTRVILRVLGGSADEIDRRGQDARSALGEHTWHPRSLVQGLRADPVVASAAESALAAQGLDFDAKLPVMPFSTDFGNVTRRIPGSMVGFGREGGWKVHFAEGEAQFDSPEGEELALTMATTLALAADRLTGIPVSEEAR